MNTELFFDVDTINQILEKKNTNRKKSWFSDSYIHIINEVNIILERRNEIKKKSMFFSFRNL